jgi:hypothetical protein
MDGCRIELAKLLQRAHFVVTGQVPTLTFTMSLPSLKFVYAAFDLVWNLISSKISGHPRVSGPQEAVSSREVVVKFSDPFVTKCAAT